MSQIPIPTPAPVRPQIRFRYLIYPKFQLTLLGIYLTVNVICFATLFYQIKEAFKHLASVGKLAGLPSNHVYYSFLELQERSLYYPYLLIALLTSLAVASILSILLSHSLAGPIVKTVTYFQQIEKDGEVRSDLSFRKKDFFSDLPVAVNAALAKLSSNRKE